MPGEGLKFRPDIEGLRAVAVVLVVLSHAGVSAFAGGYVGVDVFFVISGFLITSLLLKELRERGTISIKGFYARRMTRLLPASAVVVVATIVGAMIWLPSIRLREYGLDALSSTFYAVNLRLAATGTDYLTAASTPSPFQHFWSLAVEEQFYLVWPLLLLATWALWRRRGVVTALLGLGALSFVLSITETQRSAPWGYFGPHTRAWELAVGALIAVFSARLLRLPAAVAVVMTWAGLAGIVTAALLFDETTVFPGYAAILPVAATGLLLIGGARNATGGTGLLLNTKPFQAVGKVSYGWYLWHWPILLIAPVALGIDQPSPWINGVLALVALGLAALSYVLLENPVRHAKALFGRPWRGVGVGLGLSFSSAACVVLVVGVLAGSLGPNPNRGPVAQSTVLAMTTAQDKAAELHDLIEATLATKVLPTNLTPPLGRASKDIPVVYHDHCHLQFLDTSAEKSCAYGVPGGLPVVLFGDSHAAQWFPTLEVIAQERGWQLYAMTKSSCPAARVYIMGTTLKRPYDECRSWRESAIDRIKKIKPALVVMSTNGGDTSGALVDKSADVEKTWIDGWTSTITSLQTPTTKIALIEDTPWPKANAPECVATHPDNIQLCQRPQAEAVLNPQRRANVQRAATAAGALVIDPVGWLCADGTCPVVIGNTIVYFDASHMTVTFSRLLAPLLEQKLNTVVSHPAAP